jgi:drug/metabolite transporter (DMT)-like permease
MLGRKSSTRRRRRIPASNPVPGYPCLTAMSETTSKSRRLDLPQPAQRPRRAERAMLGWAALITVWFLWGSTYDAIRIGVRDMPPLLFAGIRFLLAALILLPIAARRREPRGREPGRREPAERRFTWANWRSAAIIGALMPFGGNGLVSIGERTLPAGIAALLVATVPLWLVVFEAFRRRRMIGPWIAAGLLLGMAGVAVLVDPTASQRIDLPAAGIVLLASASWAAGSLYSRTAPQPGQVFLGTAMQLLMGGLIMIAVGSITGEWAHFHLSQLTPAALLAIGWLAVPGSIVAFTAYIYSLKALPTSTVSTYAYVNPIVAVLIGWPLLGEKPSFQTAVAGAIIVAAVALILRAGKTH